MLRKLYKHEFYSLFRTMLPVYAALLALAVISRITLFFNNKNSIVAVFAGLSTTLYVLAIAGIFIVGVVITVMRFYKHLLSHEGYLTFTLPIKPTQHIICKMLCGVCVTAINLIIAICSLLIMAIGTVSFKELWDGLSSGFKLLSEMISTGNMILIAAEIILVLLVASCTSLLMFYAAMSLGQQFKSKIGGAVLCYFILYSAVQFIGVIIVAVAGIGFGDQIANYFTAFSVGKISLGISIYILYEAALGTAYFLISRFMLNKRLNLE